MSAGVIDKFYYILYTYICSTKNGKKANQIVLNRFRFVCPANHSRMTIMITYV